MSEKLYYHTCNNTLAHICKVIDNNHVHNVFSYLIMFILKAINPILKGHMVQKGHRILHTWSFHMNFMKLAKGVFHKSHMK